MAQGGSNHTDFFQVIIGGDHIAQLFLSVPVPTIEIRVVPFDKFFVARLDIFLAGGCAKAKFGKRFGLKFSQPPPFFRCPGLFLFKKLVRIINPLSAGPKRLASALGPIFHVPGWPMAGRGGFLIINDIIRFHSNEIIVFFIIFTDMLLTKEVIFTLFLTPLWRGEFTRPLTAAPVAFGSLILARAVIFRLHTDGIKIFRGKLHKTSFVKKIQQGWQARD